MFWSDRLKARKHNPLVSGVSYFTLNLKRDECNEAVFSQSITQGIQESGKLVRI